MSTKIVVGMSGGVDSSVTAALLVSEGYEVIGVTLRTWVERGEVERPWLDRSCCKIGVARYVAERLGIPHHVVDAQEAFRQRVVQDFLDEYQAGRTPNPCVRCNERIKFDLLLEVAERLGAALIATGHYARVAYDPERGRYRLYRGVDPRKDQSYFLYRLAQRHLAAVRFPLGARCKAEVWERAEALDLPPGEVAESQEICFVTQGDHRRFVQEARPEVVREGEVVDPTGRVLGRHPGVAFYTVGQRRGLGLGGQAAAAGGPHYVIGLDPGANRVIVGSESSLYARELVARQLNLISTGDLADCDGLSVAARIRYGSSPVPARLRVLDGDGVAVRFETPQRAVTPGQSAVFYRGDEVVGGGVIERAGDGCEGGAAALDNRSNI